MYILSLDTDRREVVELLGAVFEGADDLAAVVCKVEVISGVSAEPEAAIDTNMLEDAEGIGI